MKAWKLTDLVETNRGG